MVEYEELAQGWGGWLLYFGLQQNLVVLTISAAPFDKSS